MYKLKHKLSLFFWYVLKYDLNRTLFILNVIFQISNHTTSTIEVTCRQGFNGGIPQHFVMEVFETVNNTQVLVNTIFDLGIIHTRHFGTQYCDKKIFQ